MSFSSCGNGRDHAHDRGRGRIRALALGVALALTACSDGAATDFQPEDRTVLPGTNAAVAFSDDGTLTLSPAELVAISITTSPPGRYAVSFRLEGEALDASLDSTQLTTEDDGRATIALRAPSQATVFAIRATLDGGPSAARAVSVSASGFGAIEVAPEYGGSRPIDEWVALAVPAMSCATLLAALPADPEGAITASALPGGALMLEGAPVGPSLAVVARAGHYVYGCVEAALGMAGTTTRIDVPTQNRPIDARAAVLDASFELVPEPEPWAALTKTHLGLMTDVLTADGNGQAAALLAAMAGLAGDPAAFAAASSAHGWPGALESHLQSEGADVAAFVAAHASNALLAPTPALVGTLAGTPLEEGQGALFTLSAIGPLAAADAAVPLEYPMSLAFDPNDVAHLTGTLALVPSRYLGAAIAASALELAPPNTTFAALLADHVACDGLALAGLAGCNASCIATLCNDAVKSLWLAALDASAESELVGSLPLVASGAVSFDDAAGLTAIDGTWLAEVAVGVQKAKLFGAFVAASNGAAPAR